MLAPGDERCFGRRREQRRRKGQRVWREQRKVSEAEETELNVKGKLKTGRNHRRTDRQAHRWTHRQTDRQRGEKTGRKKDRDNFHGLLDE